MQIDEPQAGNSASGRTIVVVPTYNESENLGRLLSRLHRSNPDVDVLVVDDASPDGTGALADALAASDQRVHVLHRAGKEGLGAAYLHGFAWGLEQGYDALVEMDADGSHRPEDLRRLLRAAEQADVVIGSRWVKGGAVVNWPTHRKVLSVGGNIYTRLVLGMHVNDATAGYRVYRSEVLRKLDLASVESAGYCFQVDLTRRAVLAGLVVVEVPITFVERKHGESKMDQSIVRESLSRITGWGIQRRTEQVKERLTGRARWHRL